MTLWMVRHGHQGSVGGWAERCEIGERVALWGPRDGFGLRPDATSYLFVADESGLGAVAVLLDELPAISVGTGLRRNRRSHHVVDLPERDGVAVTWLYRGDDEAGTGARLLREVRALNLTTQKAAGLFAFGAGESRQMTQIRKYLRHEIGMAANDVSMTGYWRRNQPS